MERIARPLQQMGADIRLTSGRAPMYIGRSGSLRGITYRLPVPSAQVKSCVLLAGLRARGYTTVIETMPSRDHTERMLGASVVEEPGERHVRIGAGRRISARTWTIPSDFSAAAFFLVAGAVAPRGTLHLRRVGLNPTRSALLNVLRDMGARLHVVGTGTEDGEPVGNIRVEASTLRSVRIDGACIPLLIDEIPILAVAGALAQGRTEIRGATELRFKESDRIRTMVENLRKLGVPVEEFEDGLAVEGPAALQGNEVKSHGDHRVAMAMGVAGLLSRGQTIIEHASCTSVSFPGYWEALGSVAGGSNSAEGSSPEGSHR